MTKQAIGSRANIIKIVRTPLGFFTLAMLVVEAGLGAIALNVSGQAQLIAIYGMIGSICFLIIVVGLLGIFHPKSLTLNNNLDNNDHEAIAVTLYEYISCHREDEIKLDGTQISIVTINMKANAVMHGYRASISSMSKSLFPFTNFNIELLSFKATNNNDVKIEIIKDGDAKKRWELTIDPPLKKDDELLFTTKFTMAGHRVMCFDDLIEVAKINNYGSLFVKAWKKISIPTDNWSWIICFPKNYGIKRLQPCVLRNGNRIKGKEVELESDQHFKYFTGNDGKLRAELKFKRPLLFYGYGFAWQPPNCQEYDKLCKENNIIPFHGAINCAQQII